MNTQTPEPRQLKRNRAQEAESLTPSFGGQYCHHPSRRDTRAFNDDIISFIKGCTSVFHLFDVVSIQTLYTMDLCLFTPLRIDVVTKDLGT
jgi:hypothetical protein